MSRLYYEDGPTPRGAPPAKGPADTKQFLEKVAKLVPSEVVAGYLALVGFIAAAPEGSRVWLYWAAFALCLVLTPLYLNVQAEQGRPKRNHLIVSAAAFVVWAYAVSGAVLVPDLYHAAIASIVLVAFSLVSGVIPLDK